MNLVNNTLQGHIYNSNRLPIKDLLTDLNISDSKWDFIFDFILKETTCFYFLGERLEYSDNNLSELIISLSETDSNIKSDYRKTFFKLKAANLMISRKQLSELWVYYEYPAIIFLGDNSEESELNQL